MSNKKSNPAQINPEDIDDPTPTTCMMPAVYDALMEYHSKRLERELEERSRAQRLFSKVFPEYTEQSGYFQDCDGDIVYIIEVEQGFGSLELDFVMEHCDEADYFLVGDYMELRSEIKIRSLYDLGHALSDIEDMAKYILKSFRETADRHQDQ